MEKSVDGESKWKIPGVPHGSQNWSPFLQRAGNWSDSDYPWRIRSPGNGEKGNQNGDWRTEPGNPAVQSDVHFSERIHSVDEGSLWRNESRAGSQAEPDTSRELAGLLW